MDGFTVSQVLDRIKEKHQLKSDYALAKQTGISEQVLAHWRRGRSYPDECSCVRLAQHVDLDVDVFIAACNAARSRDPVAREAWERIAQRLLSTLSAVIFSVGLAAFFVAPDAHAAELGGTTPQHYTTGDFLYIVSCVFFAVALFLCAGAGPIPHCPTSVCVPWVPQ